MRNRPPLANRLFGRYVNNGETNLVDQRRPNFSPRLSRGRMNAPLPYSWRRIESAGYLAMKTKISRQSVKKLHG